VLLQAPAFSGEFDLGSGSDTIQAASVI